jgi:hypothetical protein
MSYKPEGINYTTFGSATDILRLKQKPVKIMCDGIEMKEVGNIKNEGYNWMPLQTGGVLQIMHSGKKIQVNIK